MNDIPSKRQILDWIAANPTQTAKRDIAKAFGIKGAARIDLKKLLRSLEAEGHLQKRKKTYRDPEKLPLSAWCRFCRPPARVICLPKRWNGKVMVWNRPFYWL